MLYLACFAVMSIVAGAAAVVTLLAAWALQRTGLLE
jgi:hypothetical protein